MSQFVRKQLTASLRLGSVLPASEDDVAPDGEGPGRNTLGGLRRLAIGVYPHRTKVMSKARLEEFPCCRIKWLAGRA
jgi:hypothetical protein